MAKSSPASMRYGACWRQSISDSSTSPRISQGCQHQGGAASMGYGVSRFRMKYLQVSMTCSTSTSAAPPLGYEMKKCLRLLENGGRLTLVAGQYQIVEIADGCRVLRTISRATAKKLKAAEWVDGLFVPMFPDNRGSI